MTQYTPGRVPAPDYPTQQIKAVPTSTPGHTRGRLDTVVKVALLIWLVLGSVIMLVALVLAGAIMNGIAGADEPAPPVIQPYEEPIYG